jgi:arabinose-5-phosphate isomerase
MLSKSPPGAGSGTGIIDCALRTLALETEGLAALSAALRAELGAAVTDAVRRFASTSGRVIVSGVGKSGHVGRKIAATLASTGTPALFLHAGEASHGDLGMITAEDAVLAMSWSGESAELRAIIDYSRRFRIALVAMTSRADSTLARAADIALVLPAAAEACPLGLAPTTSTLLQLALGDALAIALLEEKGFTALDFHDFHPGGKLGAALRSLRSVMHTGEQLPLLALGTRMADAVIMMSQKGFGCIGVIDAEGLLAGIITDGDLRRHMADNLLACTVDAVMTRSPRTLPPTALASEAIEFMNRFKITALIVLEEARPVGIVHIHDLLRIGVA